MFAKEEDDEQREDPEGGPKTIQKLSPGEKPLARKLKTPRK